MASAGDNCNCCWPRNTLGTRGFSRARRECSVLAEGRHKDLTETGKRARKVSGTQGSPEKKLRKIISSLKKSPGKPQVKLNQITYQRKQESP